MRIILLILLASTAALALTAALVRPEARPVVASHAGPEPARAMLAAAALRSSGTATPPGAMPMPAAFAMPLTEQILPAGRRAEPIDGELLEAMERIEPIIDPTRLDGPFAPAAFRIWPGTASLVDVFGERWRLASGDPNVHERVRSYALAWHRPAPVDCDEYMKSRAHPAGAPALSSLTPDDCDSIRLRASRRLDDAAPVPVIAARISLALFAAPPPGARMSSRDFWALQRERVEAMRDRLQRKWQAARNDRGEIGLRD